MDAVEPVQGPFADAVSCDPEYGLRLIGSRHLVGRELSAKNKQGDCRNG